MTWPQAIIAALFVGLLGLLMSHALAHPVEYDRHDYPHWKDFNQDCRDTRAETLISHSGLPVKFASPEGCRVTGGGWIDPYSGDTLTDASLIDIDHVVPLGWAHAHGAAEWSELKKENFANDPENLLPTHRSLNRQKGKKGMCDWRPPSKDRWCGYGMRWEHVLRKYELQVTFRDLDCLEELKAQCP